MEPKESKQKSDMFKEIDMDTKVKASSNGYYYVCTIPPHKFGEVRKDRSKKYIYLHRALLEKKLGRYLKPNEQADHIDGNKENNSEENVQLKILGDHQREHCNERGNHFWEKSKENKPGHKKKNRGKKASATMIQNVLRNYFSGS